jgi:tetratricopeptide (TPR) repeat protein
MSDKHGLMRGYTNLGFLFNEMKYPDEAIFYLQKALTQAKRVGEEIIIGTIYINIGSAHKLKGDLDKAETYYLQAETIFHRFSSLVYMGDIYEYLGWLYLDQQRWPDARQHLEQALKIWRTIDNKYGEIRTLIHLIEYEQARGDQVQASTWLKKVDDLLEQYDATGQYYQLRQQVSEIRRDLAEWSRGNNSK